MKKLKSLVFRMRFTLILFVCLSASTSFAELDKLTDAELKTLATLKKIDDFPLYEMHYYGDYGFDSFLQAGIQIDNRTQSYFQEIDAGWACTCFAALNEKGNLVFGRNFDWYRHPALILFTNPPEGYASVSMVDISYLGFDNEEPSQIERRRLLDTPYWPFDGMNEYGLAVGLMAVPYADSGQDPKKVTIGSLHVVRLLLDYAKNVGEALSLIQNYNIEFQGGPPLHYLVSDSSGNSVVIEFVEGEMRVIRNNERWQVATNFVISDVRPEGRKARCNRYRKAHETLEQEDGNISQKEAMTLLGDVSQASTLWSAVYNITTGDIQVVMGKKYSEVREFTLEIQHE